VSSSRKGPEEGGDLTEQRHAIERQAIMDASERLLSRDGATRPQIVDLLRESGVSGRWILTHRHVDLKDAFVRAVEKKWGPASASAVAAKTKYDALLERYERLSERNAELEQLVTAYAAVIDEMAAREKEAVKSNGRGNVHPVRGS
jgi:chromosome segregation ATPase